jgi:hypothetical protein
VFTNWKRRDAHFFTVCGVVESRVLDHVTSQKSEISLTFLRIKPRDMTKPLMCILRLDSALKKSERFETNLVPRLFVLTLVPRWNERQNEEPGYEVGSDCVQFLYSAQ